MKLQYIWTDGSNKDFFRLSVCMEEFYNKLVGGSHNRISFIPYNSLSDIHNVLMVYDDDEPAGCAAFKEYSDDTVEIKRVWVAESYRGRHISKEIMEKLELCAKEKGYKKAILQTREKCVEAVGLYKSIGYRRIENYPPYHTMSEAVCYEKTLL